MGYAPLMQISCRTRPHAIQADILAVPQDLQPAVPDRRGVQGGDLRRPAVFDLDSLSLLETGARSA